MTKYIPTFSFLGWVLQITFSNEDNGEVCQFDFSEKNALAMLTCNSKRLFCSKMKEKNKNAVAGRNKKNAETLYRIWSQKSLEKEWIAEVEDKPNLDSNLKPISIKYWSDKYDQDPNGAVYFHEFGNSKKIKMGVSMKKSKIKKKPIAIIIEGCKLTKRGIE
jgi:hypothetical protein